MTRLEQLRIDARLTRQELAKRAGVSLQTVINIEDGKGAQVDTLHKLAAPLKATPSELTRPAWWPSPAPESSERVA